MAYNKVANRIAKDAEELLRNNPGGLSFNELYQRLDRKYGNGRTLNRKFLGQVIGYLFRNGKLWTYKLDGQKILQLK
jgi:hypothetical protein